MSKKRKQNLCLLDMECGLSKCEVKLIQKKDWDEVLCRKVGLGFLEVVF